MITRTLVSKHNFYVLRYNSRGVGNSSGSASFTGFSEAEDLKEVVQYALKNIRDVKHVLLLVSTDTDALPLPFTHQVIRVTRTAACLSLFTPFWTRRQ